MRLFGDDSERSSPLRANPIKWGQKPQPREEGWSGKASSLVKGRWERGWEALGQCREPAGWWCVRSRRPWPQGRTKEGSQKSCFIVLFLKKNSNQPLYFQIWHCSKAKILPPPHPSLPDGVPVERVQELKVSGEEPTTVPGQCPEERAGDRCPSTAEVWGQQLPAGKPE